MSVALEPHPWNDAFTWTDHTGPFTTVTAEQVAAFDELGYFVVDDAFDAATIAAVDAAIAPGDEFVHRFLADLPDGRLGVAGIDTQTVAPHLVLRSQVLRDFCAHPLLAGIARDLVGPDVRLYWEQSVYKQPNSAEPVLWHQDNGYTYVEPQAYLTCWVALTDATPENGCVRVFPRVHRHGTLAHRDTPIGYECAGDDTIAVEVPVRAGSVVVFSSLTPHHTGRNTTDQVRKAYIVQYAPDGAVA
ncbi:MAG TPA: phytanoyl-CoA dioxygenase family protein, partial [Acidimicrobiia bacterium]|nr:phytanoyl-CoA dioxygenase family protein [Acidimicrobiia bacterium]